MALKSCGPRTSNLAAEGWIVRLGTWLQVSWRPGEDLGRYYPYWYCYKHSVTHSKGQLEIRIIGLGLPSKEPGLGVERHGVA